MDKVSVRMKSVPDSSIHKTKYILILICFVCSTLIWTQLRESTRCFQDDEILQRATDQSVIDGMLHSNIRMQKETNSARGLLPRIPLRDLLNTHIETECPNNKLVLVTDKWEENHVDDDNNDDNDDNNDSRIPHIIHVTVKSRCVTQGFADNLELWKNLTGYSFVVHNDAAMFRLLEYGRQTNFPMLSQALHCAITPASKTDIWRALVLYEYGGIYTDIDNAPGEKFFRDTTNTSTLSTSNGIIIRNSDQAFFVVEEGGFLSQYFMASEPQHPIMWWLIQQCIVRLFDVPDVERQYVPFVTGPGALKAAFQRFMNVPMPKPKDKHKANDVDEVGETVETYNRVPAGLYRSPIHTNSTITVAGSVRRSNDIVARNVLYKKRNIYKEMNMTHFSRHKVDKDTPAHNCFQRIYINEGRERHAN